MEALRNGHLDATQLVDRFVNSFDGNLDGMLSLVQCRDIELGAVIMTSTTLDFLPQYPPATCSMPGNDNMDVLTVFHSWKHSIILA